MRAHLTSVWWNPLDPLSGLSDAVVSGYKWMTKALEKFLMSPITNMSDNAAIRLIVSSQANLAMYLAYVTLGLMLIVAVFLMKGKKLGHALAVWAILSVLTPIWVDLVLAMRDFGIQLAELVTKLDLPTASTSLNDPLFDEPIIGILFMGIALMLGGLVASLVVGNEFIIVFFMIWWMPAFAISAIGERSKKVSNIILAFGLTSTMFSRASISFFLDMGTWAIDSLPFGNTAFGAAVLTIASYLFALVFQLVLVVAMYHAVTAIEGKIKAAVAGTAVATIKHVVKVDMRQWLKNRHQQPMPVTVVNPQPSRSSRVREQTKKVAKQAAVNSAAAGATAAGQPQMGIVIKTYGSKFVS